MIAGLATHAWLTGNDLNRFVAAISDGEILDICFLVMSFDIDTEGPARIAAVREEIRLALRAAAGSGE